ERPGADISIAIAPARPRLLDLADRLSAHPGVWICPARHALSGAGDLYFGFDIRVAGVGNAKRAFVIRAREFADRADVVRLADLEQTLRRACLSRRGESESYEE